MENITSQIFMVACRQIISFGAKFSENSHHIDGPPLSCLQPSKPTVCTCWNILMVPIFGKFNYTESVKIYQQGYQSENIQVIKLNKMPPYWWPTIVMSAAQQANSLCLLKYFDGSNILKFQPYWISENIQVGISKREYPSWNIKARISWNIKVRISKLEYPHQTIQAGISKWKYPSRSRNIKVWEYSSQNVEQIATILMTPLPCLQPIRTGMWTDTLSRY